MVNKPLIGLVFDTEIEAKNWDWHHNKLNGSISKYMYNRVPLNSTTTLTKAQYAELYNIPATIETVEGESIANPEYEALESSYTLRKYAAIVHTETPIYTEVYNEETNTTEQVLLRTEIYNPLAVRDEETGEQTGYACPYCGEEFEVVEITDDMIFKQEVV